MKNFRKVLALVLVVATLFSFTAMAGAAYKDEANISYDEAVAVLSAVGILNGYEDETFKPTQTISREEMAKMIAVLANAGDDVSALYASASTFADVPASKWSASYVAYCAKTGIVAGRSATTFDPAGKVTGLETAKMLLVTLGFDADEQGYVGADWKVNVLRDAKVMGLLNNFAADYDVDVAITREEAAQMMLNALEAPCVVGVVSDGLVTVTNALIVSWPEAGSFKLGDLLTVSAYAKLKDAMDAGKWCLYGNAVISNDLLCDRLFDMEKSTGRDCYGRPSVIWTINDKKLVAFPEASIWSSTNTTREKALDVLEDKGLKLTAEYVDGFDGEIKGGKGALVEVFADGTVIEINTFIGEIGQLNTAKKTFVIEGWNGDEIVANNVYGFEVEDEGAAILYWTCNETGKNDDDVHTVEVVEPSVITLHGTRGEAAYFCDTDENKYEYAKNFLGEKVDSQALKLADIYVYTDKYGYVMSWTDKTVGSKIAVLVSNSAVGSDKVITAANPDGKYTKYVAEFVDFEDGAKPVEYVIDATTFNVDEAAASDVLVKYTPSGDKRVKATAVMTTAHAVDYTLSASGKVAGLDKAANNDTQYILRVYNYDGTYTYKYFDGKGEVDAAYLLTNLQYTVVNGVYLGYVYAEAKYAEASKLAFVTDFYTDEAYIDEVDVNGDPMTYYLYKALVNGEEAYVAYDAMLDDGMMQMYKAEYVLINAESHDGLPVYMAVGEALVTAGKDFVIEGDTLVFDNNGFDAADMAENADIWVIEETSKGVTVVDIDDYSDVVDYLTVHGWENVYAYLGYTDGEVTTMYLYVKG